PTHTDTSSIDSSFRGQEPHDALDSRASLVIINDGRAKPWNRIDAQCRNAILSQGGKRPFVAHPAAQKAITGIERHEQRRRMAGARSSRFEELAGELSPLRVL